MKNLDLQSLLQVSQEIGLGAPLWVQGAGGNLSLKKEEILFIKSTGVRLDKITEPRGLAQIKLKSCLEDLQALFKSETESSQAEKKYFDLVTKNGIQDPSLGRPSMETGFHVVLPQTFVLHFHALSAVLMYEQAKKNQTSLMTWIKKEGFEDQVAFIEYQTPGLRLSERLACEKNKSIYLLENHGVILQGPDLKIWDVWKALELRFCQTFHYGSLHSLLSEPRTSLQNLKKMFSLKKELQVYFPDTAVFKHKIKDWFEAPSASSTDEIKNLEEIWWATQLLKQLEPNLKELSDDEQLRLSMLPSEKIRLKNLQRKNQ